MNSSDEFTSDGTANGSTVQWSGLQNSLEQAESDTLLLLDCCSAGCSVSGESKGVTEMIAACGFETSATGVGEHSFTRSLIDELKYWSRHRGILTVAMLHEQVLRRIKHWKPRYGPHGRVQECRKTPIYVVLSSEGKQRSIELSPFRPEITLPAELAVAVTPMDNTDSSSASSSISSNIHGNKSDSTPSSSDSELPNNKEQTPRVLVSVALEEDQHLQTNEWLHFL